MYATKKEYHKRKTDVKEQSAQHKKGMVGKKTILIPHPTIPKTWIEKIVEE